MVDKIMGLPVIESDFIPKLAEGEPAIVFGTFDQIVPNLIKAIRHIFIQHPHQDKGMCWKCGGYAGSEVHFKNIKSESNGNARTIQR